MQVFLILFSIYFAHNQPLILNPYIELTLNYLCGLPLFCVCLPSSSVQKKKWSKTANEK